MKSMKKVIPAIAMLIVSAVLMSTASYAWFSMSREVTATGISMTAKAPTNLLISNTSSNAGFAATVEFENVYTGSLYPASTVDGVTFHAIEKNSYIGSGGIGGILPTTGGTAKFLDSATVVAMGKNSTTAEGYFAEYTLYLKTTGNSAIDVTLKSLDIGETTVSEDTLYKCVRVAIFNGEASTANLVGIWATDSEYVNSIKSSTAGTTTYETEIVELATLTGDENTPIIPVAANGVVTTLTVRVWIEGQHPECLNKVAGQDFNVGLTFSGTETP